MAVVPALGGASTVSNWHGYQERLSVRGGSACGGSGSGAVVIGGGAAPACAVSLASDSGPGGRALEERERSSVGGCRGGFGRGVKLLLSAGGRLWRNGRRISSRRRRCGSALETRSLPGSLRISDDGRHGVVLPRAAGSSSESGNWMGSLVSRRSQSYDDSFQQAEEFECKVLSIGPAPGDVAEMEAFCRVHRFAEELHEVVMKALWNHSRAKDRGNQEARNLSGEQGAQMTENGIAGERVEGERENGGDVPEWEEKVVAGLACLATVLHEGRAQVYSAAAAAAAAAEGPRFEGGDRMRAKIAPVSPLACLREEVRKCTMNLKESVDEVLLPDRELTNVYRAIERLRNLCLDAGFPRSPGAPSHSDIPNFARVTQEKAEGGQTRTLTGDWFGMEGDNILFCRGGQPTDDGVEWLICNGFKAIVDLRGPDRGNQLVKPTDLETRIPVIRIPMDVGGVPTTSQVQQFTRIAEDPYYRPFFVHSTRGLGRACALIARWKQLVLVETLSRSKSLQGGQASRGNGGISTMDSASTSCAGEQLDLQSPEGPSSRLENSQGGGGMAWTSLHGSTSNGSTTTTTTMSNDAGNNSAELVKNKAEVSGMSIGGVAGNDANVNGKTQAVEANLQGEKSSRASESTNGAVTKAKGEACPEGERGSGLRLGKGGIGREIKDELVVHIRKEGTAKQTTGGRQVVTEEPSLSPVANATVADKQHASRDTVPAEAVVSPGVSTSQGEGEEEETIGDFYLKGSVFEAQRPGPGAMSREGMSLFLKRKKVVPNSLIASANRGRGRITHVTTVVVKGDDKSIAGAAGRWGRKTQGIPRAGIATSTEKESLSSEVGTSGTKQLPLPGAPSIQGIPRVGVSASKEKERSSDTKKRPVSGAHSTSAERSGTYQLPTAKNGAVSGAGGVPSTPDGPPRGYNRHPVFAPESASSGAFERCTDVAEGGEISTELSGSVEDVELTRQDSRGSLADLGRVSLTLEREIGKVLGNNDEADEDESVVEEVVMMEGDMCSSTTGVVRLQSRRKAEMYLVRTDGFSCTRERVRESTLAFTHPSTQQQMLMWKTPPQTVLLLKKLGDELMDETMEVASWLYYEERMDVVVEPEVYGRLARRPGYGFVQTYYAQDTTELQERVDFVVCLGGDGVILHASTIFRTAVPPVVSFNLGSLGFLTAHPFEDFKQDLKRIIYGNSTMDGVYITLRMRLRCELFRNGRAIPGKVFDVLNEVVVDRGSNPYLCKIECYERNRLITKVQADGVIVATPTGSTAYSTAAGGSMVHPNVPCMLFTPICPHSLSFRPVILPDSALLELRVPSDARFNAWASFDGKQRQQLFKGDSVRICMSEHPLPTVNKHDQTDDWFQSLVRCLNWNERKEQKALRLR